MNREWYSSNFKNLSSNATDDSNDETNFPYKSLLTDTQI